MEVAASFLGSLGAEPGRRLVSSISDKIQDFLKFKANFSALDKEMIDLLEYRNSVNQEIETAGKEGQIPRIQVKEWLRKINVMEIDVNSLRGNISNITDVCGCSLNCFHQYKLSRDVARELVEVRRLIVAASSFPDGVSVANRLPEVVEHIPGPSIEDQPTGSTNLAKLMSLLNDDTIKRIGVWGMGGAGKTTLVKNLNNKLKGLTQPPFSIVIWVTVSKDLDLRRVRTEIAHRLNLILKTEDSEERMAIRLHQRLQKEESFLLILDDVWDAIDLDLLGIPRPEVHAGVKIILTTRFLEVCGEMLIDFVLKVEVLSSKEAWQLFSQHVGEVAMLEDVEPIAKEITRECNGLPLALIVVGASMRGKTVIQLWKDALNSLRRSVPLIRGIEDKVYKPLRWSYDLLQGEHIKTCFLFCCLYPEDFSIEVSGLVDCWFAEGLLDEHQTLDEICSRGMAIVERLKDSCLLQHGAKEGTVKMHDIVRDVAIWIASSLEDGSRSLVRSGLSLRMMLESEHTTSSMRVSFMNNVITALPVSFIRCPHASTLLLQGNHSLDRVPSGFLLAFPFLRVLDLSATGITSLPISLMELKELRALLLCKCGELQELPQIGALSKLQVLNCSETGLVTLPEGMEKLTNLRELYLQETKFLKTIYPQTLSNLSSLELLDMRDSAYKWDTKTNVDEGQATFEELFCLEQLILLRINLRRIPCPALELALTWIKRLGTFRISIGNYKYLSVWVSSCQREVIVYDMSLSGEWIGWLFTNATSVVLYVCWDLDQMIENLAINASKYGCFAGLKSLHISCYGGSFWPAAAAPPCDAQLDLLPNLEQLFLSDLDRLSCISEIAGHLGLRFSRLRFIRLEGCLRLKYLLSIGDLTSRLENLQKITVRSCGELDHLFDYASSSSQITALNHVVPNLRIVKLKNLPKLQSLCRQNESWQRLQQLEVMGCGLIKKLPLTAENADTVKQIRGEQQWWNRLEWENDGIKSGLEQLFSPFDIIY